MGGVPDPNFGGADDVAPDANVVAGHLLFLCARLTRYREEEAGGRHPASLAMDQTVRGMEPVAMVGGGDDRRATISRTSRSTRG